MKIIKNIAIVSFSLSLIANAQDRVELKEVKKGEIVKVAKDEDKAKVQIAILLDTSGSMNGLITQAQDQLWDLVNAFITAKVGGETPFVEVSLYGYGQSSSGEKKDYIKRIEPLTRDLDKVSQELFALKTSGSHEYCGTVIARAVSELEWDSNPNTYKAIFIAGNESFKQGGVDASKSCKDAIAKGIIVNSIYCGEESKGISEGWSEAPKLADGTFAFINHNQAVVNIEAPQDEEILEFNKKLNKTYVTYNESGKERAELQDKNDESNAKLSKNSIVKRALSKSSVNYWNSSWDLVDASSEENFDWESVKDENLPKDIQGKTLDEKKEWVSKKRNERVKIQREIAELNEARKEYVLEERKRLKEENGESLDTVMTETVVEQAKKKGYVFEK